MTVLILSMPSFHIFNFPCPLLRTKNTATYSNIPTVLSPLGNFDQLEKSIDCFHFKTFNIHLLSPHYTGIRLQTTHSILLFINILHSVLCILELSTVLNTKLMTINFLRKKENLKELLLTLYSLSVLLNTQHMVML